jgi:RNA polymerase sigma-70 factor, ECF subfamily
LRSASVRFTLSKANVPLLDPDLIGAVRPRLVRLAYRMLGAVAEAEDAVQEALLRVQRSDAAIDNPEGFLARTVTRVCLDTLKSARRRRETYVGPWLPEPIFDAREEVHDDVTLTLMMALERLSPLERAAFLLHDVFGVGLDEVAVALEREPAACRKLASRAREHVREARPRYPMSAHESEQIAEAFHAASRAGDVTSLKRLLAEGVVVYSDGGGKSSAATKPVLGESRVLRFFIGLARKCGYAKSRFYQPTRIDGLPGFISVGDDGVPQTTALALEDGLIRAIYIVRNPDKLQHLLHAEPALAALLNVG